MGYEPSGPFITSVLEVKLDTSTMFEWQRHSQESTDVPNYSALLKFLNLQVQASETAILQATRVVHVHLEVDLYQKGMTTILPDQ